MRIAIVVDLNRRHSREDRHPGRPMSHTLTSLNRSIVLPAEDLTVTRRLRLERGSCSDIRHNYMWNRRLERGRCSDIRNTYVY